MNVWFEIPTKSGVVRIDVPRLPASVGSSPSAEVRLRHSSVAAFHALIHLSEDGISLSGIEPRNRLIHKGKECRSIQLNDGDRIKIGEVPVLVKTDWDESEDTDMGEVDVLARDATTAHSTTISEDAKAGPDDEDDDDEEDEDEEEEEEEEEEDEDEEDEDDIEHGDQTVFDIVKAVVQISDGNVATMVAITGAGSNLVRVNLIAYYAFNVAVFADRLLGAAHARRFEGQLLESIVEQGALERVGGIAFLRSRFRGWASAAQDFSEGTDSALANYFQACCSVNRALIYYFDTYPNPDDLQRTLDTFGGTSAGYALLERIRSLDQPATYPIDGIKSARVSVELLAGAEGMKAMVQRVFES